MDLYASKLYQKVFRGNKSKETYLKACGWIATKIVSNEKVNNNVVYTISKGYDSECGLFIYTITVFAKINEDEIVNRHCNICKELNGSFLMKEEIKCDWCKLQAYLRREEQMLKEKKLFVKHEMLGDGFDE